MDEIMPDSDLEKAEDKKGRIAKRVFEFKRKLKESPNDSAPIIYDMAVFLFEEAYYEEALNYFINCFEIGYRKDELLSIILTTYYEPNIDEFRSRYNKNIEKLKKYPYINMNNILSFEQLKYLFIPYSDTEFKVYDKIINQFIFEIDLLRTTLSEDFQVKEQEKENVVFLEDCYNVSDIHKVLKMTRLDSPITWMKCPLYLYYNDAEILFPLLQVIDFEEILLEERVVFLFGEEQLFKWFENPQAVLPTAFISSYSNTVSENVCKIFLKRQKEKDDVIKQIKEYYGSIPKNRLMQTVLSGKPRVLFVTSIFTTALQYYIRDCVIACDKLGIPNRLVIEKDNISRVINYDFLLVVAEFKPDIIFIIDYFRWQLPEISGNVVFASWLHDLLPHIFSKESAAKTEELDFILNPLFSSSLFEEIGYPKDQIIEAPITVNPSLYKEYVISNEEYLRYNTEICVFSNAADPKVGLKNVLSMVSSSDQFDALSEVLVKTYLEAYNLAYNEEPLYLTVDFQKLMEKYSEEVGILIDKIHLEKIAESFRNEIGFRILRAVPIEWLHERGYNMKLWGREWLEHPVLKKYAQGVAPNGETLSKIISTSKIVVGTNPAISAHPRVFETILSNCFYLGVNIPEQHDWANIRKYMNENEEIIFSYNKKDLYEKIDYYLENENERTKIIEKGKEKILSCLTYEAMIKSVIREIGQRMQDGLNS